MIWLVELVNRASNPAMPDLVNLYTARHCLDEYHETLKRKRKEKVQLVRTLPSC